MTATRSAAAEVDLLVDAVDDLLAELALHKILCGPAERMRLEIVLRHHTDLHSLDDLAQTVAAVVVKTREQAVQFQEVFELWKQRAATESHLPAPERLPPPPRLPVPRWKRAVRAVRAHWRFGLLSTLLIGGAVLAWAIWPTNEEQVAVEQPPTSPPSSESVNAPPQYPDQVAESRILGRICVPIPTKLLPPWYDRYPVGPMAFSLVALLATAALAWASRRLPTRPPRPPAPVPRGWGVVVLDPSPPDDNVVLDAKAEDALVWGMGHYVSEETTGRMDVATTIRATAAAAGLPAIHYHRAREHRGVWIWRDTSEDLPELALLADEVVRTLTAAGLPAEESTFFGVPDALYDAHGHRLGLGEIDDRQRQARVAVLTSGAAWAALTHTQAGQARLEPTRRQLAHWPALGVALCGADAPELRTWLDRQAITTLAPEQVVSFLSGLPLSDPDPSLAVANDPLWEFACALSPWPVSLRQALRLHRVLDLPAERAHLSILRRQSRGSSERMSWPHKRRAELARWAEAALGYTKPHASSGPVDRAVAFWRQQSVQMRQRLAERPGWRGSESEALHTINHEVLGLWMRDPHEAIHQLHRQHQAGMNTEVEAAISAFVPADVEPQHGQARLPWHSGDLHTNEQAMLHELGMTSAGFDLLASPPARRRMGLALAAGCAAGALAAALIGMYSTADEPPAELSLAAGATAPDQCLPFVSVPAGTYSIGSADRDPDAESDEQPIWQARFPTGFWIGEFEITNSQYARFESTHTYATDQGDHPVARVSWDEALEFCEALGAVAAEASDSIEEYRLPSEAEWEAAARGTDGRTYPWGNESPDDKKVVWKTGATAAVGVPTDAIGPFGTRHQAGNVWEWVMDCYDEDAYKKLAIDKATDNFVNLAAHCQSQVLRGGSFDFQNPRNLRSANRNWLEPGNRNQYIGFRCVRGARRQP